MHIGARKPPIGWRDFCGRGRKTKGVRRGVPSIADRGRHRSPASELSVLPHLQNPTPVRIQPVLDSEDAFSEGVEDRFAFEKKARVSGESFDITSISFKRGAERFFDIIH